MSCSMFVNSSSEMRPSPETSTSLKMRSSLRIYFFFVAWQARAISTWSNAKRKNSSRICSHQHITQVIWQIQEQIIWRCTSATFLPGKKQNLHKLVLRANASFSDMTTSWSSPAASRVSLPSRSYAFKKKARMWNARINICLGPAHDVFCKFPVVSMQWSQTPYRLIGMKTFSLQTPQQKIFFHRYVQCSNYLMVESTSHLHSPVKTCGPKNCPHKTSQTKLLSKIWQLSHASQPQVKGVALYSLHNPMAVSFYSIYHNFKLLGTYVLKTIRNPTNPSKSFNPA